MNVNNDRTPAVLLEINLQALKVIRSLGRRGIPVIGVVVRAGRWEHFSRYCEIRVCEHVGKGDEFLLDFLVRLAGEFTSKPVLIPMHDDHVLFVSRNEARLSEHYRFLVAPQAVMHDLVSKSGVSALAQRFGMAQPATYQPKSMPDVVRLSKSIQFPALIKPEFSRSWQNKKARKLVSGKVVVVDSKEEMIERYEVLATIDDRLVIQEIIPGPDDRLAYYIGYFDAKSDPVASFVGVKKRVTPIHFGSASYVVSCRDARLTEICVCFMKDIGYRGHVGIEVKYDDRDDMWKLIEVNARFGLWDGLAALCGIDFAYINYQYLHNEIPSVVSDYDEGVKWISFSRDLSAFAQYRKENEVGFWDWIVSLYSGRRDYAVFAWDDPMPFLKSSYDLLAERVRLRR